MHWWNLSTLIVLIAVGVPVFAVGFAYFGLRGTSTLVDEVVRHPGLLRFERYKRLGVWLYVAGVLLTGTTLKGLSGVLWLGPVILWAALVTFIWAWIAQGRERKRFRREDAEAANVAEMKK